MPISRVVPTPAADSFEHKQVLVSTTKTLVLAANPDRLELIISNASGLAVYIGDSGNLTASNGLIVLPNTTLILSYYTGQIWALTALGDATISLAQIPRP